MALNVGELSATLDLDRKPFESGMGRVGGLMRGAAKAAAVAGVAIAGGLAAGAVKGTMAFRQFDDGMREVFTLLPGISDKAMGDMTGQVKDFAVEFGVLPDKVIPALYDSLSAGVPPGNVFDFLETAQQAAKGGATDLQTAVNGITGVVNAYGADVIDAATASDVMFTTVRLGKTTFDELSASLSDVTPIAGALGVSFEEVSAAMAASTAITGNTAKSATGLKSMLAELGKEGQAAATVFADAAGKSFPDFIAEGGNLAEALQLMQDHANETGGSLVDMFGGIEAGQAALQLAGAESFTTALDEMENSAGATQTAYETMSDGVGLSFDRLKAAGSVALLEIGSRVAPMLASFAEGFADKLPAIMATAEGALDTLSAWWDQNGPGIIAAVTSVRDGVVDFIETVGPPIRDWVENVLGELAEWWAGNGPTIVDAAMDIADGIETVATIVAGAVAAIVRHWDTLRGPVATIAGLIAAVFIPHWIAAGTAAVTSAARQAGAWVATQTGALRAAATHSAQVAVMIARWVAAGAVAAAQAAVVVAAWVAMGAGAIANTAVAVAQFAMQIGRWIALGATALVSAAQVALAWLIAIGPIAIVIAAVVGVVALIITQWDKIKAGTVAAWNAVTGAVTSAISTVVSFISGLPGKAASAMSNLARSITDVAVRAGTSLLGAVTGFIGDAVAAVAELPGKAVAALGNLSSTLLGAGRDLIGGFTRGIRNSAGSIIATISSAITSKLPGWIKGPLGISSPSRVTMALGREVSRGMAAGILDAAKDVDRAVQRIALAPTAIPATGRLPTPAAATAGTALPAGFSGTVVAIFDGEPFTARITRVADSRAAKHTASAVSAARRRRNAGAA